MIQIAYTGLDRAGIAHTGQTEVINVAAFVRRRYRGGWKSLTVFRPGSEDILGMIVRNDNGRRVAWWDSSSTRPSKDLHRAGRL